MSSVFAHWTGHLGSECRMGCGTADLLWRYSHSFICSGGTYGISVYQYDQETIVGMMYTPLWIIYMDYSLAFYRISFDGSYHSTFLTPQYPQPVGPCGLPGASRTRPAASAQPPFTASGSVSKTGQQRQGAHPVRTAPPPRSRKTLLLKNVLGPLLHPLVMELRDNVSRRL